MSSRGKIEEEEVEDGSKPEGQGEESSGNVLRFRCSLTKKHTLGVGLIGAEKIGRPDDERIVYASGRDVIVYDEDTRQCHYMDRVSTNIITCISVCSVASTKKSYVAVADHTDGNSPQVVIHSLVTGKKVRPSVAFGGISDGPVTAIGMSPDARAMATCVASPTPSVQLWKLDKQRPVFVAELESPATRVSVCPAEMTHVCTSGGNSLQLWRIVEGVPRATSPFGSFFLDTVTDHVWVDAETILAGLASGSVAVIRRGEVIKTIDDVLPQKSPVLAICLFKKGFVVGGAGGHIAVFERPRRDTEYNYTLYRAFSSRSHMNIVGLSISPSNESIICALENHELQKFMLANVDIMRDEEDNFETIRNNFHVGDVTDFQVCSQLPLTISSSAHRNDYSVRLHNFFTRHNEVEKQFHDEPLSCAIDPTGHRALVGFSYKLEVFDILYNDLRNCFEIPVKNCRLISFSRGGHLFAIACSSIIYVFNSTTFAKIAQLRGHTGQIRSLHWNSTDTRLLSAGSDGALYEWNPRADGSPLVEVLVRGCQQTCARYDHTDNTFYTCGTDGVIRQVDKGEITFSTQCIPGVMPTKLYMCEQAQTLVVGTDQGNLLLYHLPFKSDGVLPYVQVLGHTAPVILLDSSKDDSLLFSTALDGTMIMWDITCFDFNRTLQRRVFDYSIFGNVIAVDRGEYEEKLSTIEFMKADIRRVESEMERLQASMSKEMREKLKALEGEKDRKLQELSDKLATSGDASQEEILFLKSQIKQREKKTEETYFDLETTFQEKLRRLEEKNRKLENFITGMEVERDKREEYWQREKQAEFDAIHEHFQEQMKSKEAEIESVHEEYNKLKMEFEETMKQHMDDHEALVDTMKVQYETKLEQERMKVSEYKDKLVKNLSEMRKAEAITVKATQDVESRDRKIEALNHKVNDSVKQTLQRDISVREETISSKERGMTELKKETSELEKLRSVLTYKLNETRHQMVPKDEQIAEMTEAIKDMDALLQEITLQKESLELVVKQQSEKIVVLNHENAKYRRQVEERNARYDNLVKDLGELLNRTDPKMLFAAFKAFLASLCVQGKEKKPDNRDTLLREFDRQRSYIENQLTSIRRREETAEKSVTKMSKRFTAENNLLVKELNMLRKENKEFKRKVSTLEAQLREASKDRPSTAASYSIGGRSSSMGPTQSLRGSTAWQADRPDSTLPNRPASGASVASVASTNAAFGRMNRPESSSSVSTTHSRLPSRLSNQRKPAETLISTVNANHAVMDKQREELAKLRKNVQDLLGGDENLSGDEHAQDSSGNGGFVVAAGAKRGIVDRRSDLDDDDASPAHDVSVSSPLMSLDPADIATRPLFHPTITFSQEDGESSPRARPKSASEVSMMAKARAEAMNNSEADGDDGATDSAREKKRPISAGKPRFAFDSKTPALPEIRK